MNFARRISTSVIISLIATTALATFGVTTSQASGYPTVSSAVYATNCGTLSQKPTSLTIYCADAGVSVIKIVWKSWGKNGATGTGVYSANNCTPTCAGGTFINAPVTIKLAPPTAIKGKLVMMILSIKTSNGKKLPLLKKSSDVWKLI